MHQKAQQAHETAQSAISYTIGGGSVAASTLMDVADKAEAIAIIAGCGVVIIRLIYDGIRLCRYVRGKSQK